MIATKPICGKKLSAAALLALFCAGFVPVAGVHAQSASTGAASTGDANGGLAEIVVTAERKTENLQNVPISASVFDSKALKEEGYRIAVDDFDAAHAELKSKSVHFLNEPFALGTNRLVFFNDGDGNLCHLIKREKPLP